MRFQDKATETPWMVQAVAKRVAAHAKDRILVHTVSGELARNLYENVPRYVPGKRPYFAYSYASQRERVLAEFRQSDAGVIFAQSLDRGVDLPDDDTRVIIIAKVPSPNLGDEVVRERLYTTGARGRAWYAVQTIRSMVQMTGRGMRSEDDWCVSYILDSQFGSNVWKNNHNLLPRWWRDSIMWLPVTMRKELPEVYDESEEEEAVF